MHWWRVWAACARAATGTLQQEFDTTIDLAGQDGTEEHTLELCLFKADQVTGPAPMPGATSTRYNNVKLHILHEPPSAPPPSPAAPVARPPAFPGLPSGVCWDHFTRMKEDGYDSFSGGDINIKCRNFAGDTCHDPTSEHFGCNSVVGHYCQRSCGCCDPPLTLSGRRGRCHSSAATPVLVNTRRVD